LFPQVLSTFFHLLSVFLLISLETIPGPVHRLVMILLVGPQHTMKVRSIFLSHHSNISGIGVDNIEANTRGYGNRLP
jgi:hypothetical protein